MKLIVIRKITIYIVVVFLFVSAVTAYYVLRPKTVPSFLELDENVQRFLSNEVKYIFNHRNESILKADSESLKKLYNMNSKNAQWAYEHDIKKMKYLHSWSDKQGVEFKDINSHIIVRYAKVKGEGYNLNLLVSTEYIYKYKESNSTNSFRIGTYHTIDIMSSENNWIINREWYNDPFADSLDLDTINNQKVKDLILSGEQKQIKDLNERRIKAIEYADMYCGAASLPEYGFKYNSNYRDYNNAGGDCANFASQMLFEGAQFRKNRTWNYERGAGSKSWLNAHAFNSYMLNSGRASVIARGTYKDVISASYKFLPGDYVAYEKKGKVTHISVVTASDSKGYALVNSHNADRYRVPWDLGWSNKGVEFVLVRVHY